MSNTKSSNQTAVPEAKGALDRFKFEVANELGVPLTDGYNGNLTSKQNGSVGGYMVKKIVSEQPLNFNSIFYIIPRVIVNYRTTFPGRFRQSTAVYHSATLPCRGIFVVRPRRTFWFRTKI